MRPTRQPKYTRGRRAVRLLGLTRNPLRRRVDRLERTLRIACTLALLAVVAISTMIVLGTYHRTLDRVTAERARLQRVSVVLLGDAVSGRAASGTVSTPPTPGVPASWTLPDGSVRTGSVYGAPAGAAEGSAAQVWMDENFDPVRPPAEPGELRFRAGANVLGCVSLFGLLIWGFYQWCRTKLDAHRDAGWTRDWHLFERQWRDRLH